MFFAINVASLTSVGQFNEEMDEQIRTTCKAKPRKRFDRVTLPGEIEWELTQERGGNGIPLHKSQVQTLDELAGAATWSIRAVEIYFYGESR